MNARHSKPELGRNSPVSLFSQRIFDGSDNIGSADAQPFQSEHGVHDIENILTTTTTDRIVFLTDLEDVSARLT